MSSFRSEKQMYYYCCAWKRKTVNGSALNSGGLTWFNAVRSENSERELGDSGDLRPDRNRKRGKIRKRAGRQAHRWICDSPSKNASLTSLSPRVFFFLLLPSAWASSQSFLFTRLFPDDVVGSVTRLSSGIPLRNQELTFTNCSTKTFKLKIEDSSIPFLSWSPAENILCIYSRTLLSKGSVCFDKGTRRVRLVQGYSLFGCTDSNMNPTFFLKSPEDINFKQVFIDASK